MNPAMSAGGPQQEVAQMPEVPQGPTPLPPDVIGSAKMTSFENSLRWNVIGRVIIAVFVIAAFWYSHV